MRVEIWERSPHAGSLRGDRRRQMCVYPNRHASNSGRFSLREAYGSAAFKSSASRSGISSKVCSALSPATNKSSTSETRILIPQMQGRPLHCFGLIVVLLSKSDIGLYSEMNLCLV